MSINETNEQNTGRTSGIVTKIVAGGALAAALGGWWYQSNEVNSMRGQLVATEHKMEQLHGQMDTSVAMAKAEVNETVAKMNEQVEKARRDAMAGVQRVQVVAKKQSNEVLTTLAAKNDALAQQLDAVKKDSEEKTSKVNETLTGIQGDVTTVKTDVASTKTELEKTANDLKRVTGDMGVMSGLIATNGDQLAQLRKLGERDYFEFTLNKNTKAPQRVGDIQLALKKADLKRNKFTINVLADDKTVEKKDKGLNEPVQFYTSSARLPYEVVINEIRKDQVIGYLAVPKVKMVAQR